MGTVRRLFVAAAAAAAIAALPAGGAHAAGSVEHTVRSGDNLHLIAGYYYKDPRQWKLIWRENRGRVRNANVLRPGSSLRVPPGPGGGWDIPYEEFVARVRGR